MATPRDPMHNLISLDELDDFRVASDEPDPRGWEIIARDGRKIGEVDELIVDTSAMKVRYLDCELDEEELGLEERDRHILIPVGFARLDEDDKKVLVDTISSADVSSLPEFTGDVSQDYDERFSSFSSVGRVTDTGLPLGGTANLGGTHDWRIEQSRGTHGGLGGTSGRSELDS